MSIVKDMKERGIFLSKRRGQCLLTDNNIMEKILRTANLGPDDLVLDIGCGPGYTIERLAGACKFYVGVEIDRKCFEMALEKTAALENCLLIHADMLAGKHALNSDVLASVADAVAAREPEKVKVVANLPYNVATPVTLNLLQQNDLNIDLMVIMVQREMAHKMTALPGGPSYGSVAVMVEALSAARMVFDVSRNSFFPRPKVDSAVVDVVPAGTGRRRMPDADMPEFERFVKNVFNIRIIFILAG